MEERAEIGRRLAALRRRVTLECEQCHAPTVGYGGKRAKRFCSARCQMQAYRKALKEKASTTPPQDREG